MDNKAIVELFTFQRGYLSLLVDDIPDDRLTHQPGGLINHPAWQIGHLAWAADNLNELLAGSRRLEKAWADTFAMGSRPVADRAAYPSKRELLAALDERRTTAAALMAAATDALLRQPNPSPALAPMLPTVGHMALFVMIMHEGTHFGQLSSWRKAAGMVEALSKFAR